MANTSKSEALAKRLERVYADKANRLGKKLQECGYNEDIIQVMQKDLHRVMLYTGESFIATMAQVKEFVLHDGFPQVKKWGKDSEVDIALLVEDYLHLGAVIASAESLEMLLSKGGVKTPDGSRLYDTAADTLQQAYNKLSLTAVIFADKYINLIPIREDAQRVLIQDKRRRGLMQVVSFIVNAIHNAAATDEEIVDYLKGGYWEIDKLITFIEIARDCHSKMIAGRTGKMAAVLYESMLQAGSKPLLLATEQRARAAGDGEDVGAACQVPSGVYTLKQVIEQAQEKENIKAEQICEEKRAELEIKAVQAGASEEEIRALTASVTPQPLHISELKICQIYNALQVIATTQHVTPIVSNEGVELFKYSTSLRSLAKEAFGLTNPNGEELKQTMAALVILDTWRVAIEETRYKDIKTAAGTKKRQEKRYRHYVKLISLPRITTLVNEDGTIANATDSELELHLHPLLKTGVRQKAPVGNGKDRELIAAPMTQYIPYEVFEKSRKYFRSNDGSGQRFYNMILAKNNKHEEDMLAEIFDYEGEVRMARSAAEKRVRKRHQKRIEARNEAERMAYIMELAERGITLEIMIKEEADAEEKKKRRTISKHKSRNLETLKSWFEQAEELALIQPNYTRLPAKRRAGYVWRWERVKEDEQQ